MEYLQAVQETLALFLHAQIKQLFCTTVKWDKTTTTAMPPSVPKTAFRFSKQGSMNMICQSLIHKWDHGNVTIICGTGDVSLWCIDLRISVFSVAKLSGLVGCSQCLGMMLWPPPSEDSTLLVKNGTRLVSHPTEDAFSNCGTLTTTGMPITLYHYSAL